MYITFVVGAVQSIQKQYGPPCRVQKSPKWNANFHTKDCISKNLTNLKICFYYKIHNFYPIITNLCQNKVLMLLLTKICNDWVKIVDFSPSRGNIFGFQKNFSNGPIIPKITQPNI